VSKAEGNGMKKSIAEEEMTSLKIQKRDTVGILRIWKQLCLEGRK
jgi:hypothetical protein